MFSQLSYSGLFLAVFARQLCLPVPAILFLITAGALAAHGQLHVTLVVAAGILGCLAGDFIWFRMRSYHENLEGGSWRQATTLRQTFRLK